MRRKSFGRGAVVAASALVLFVVGNGGCSSKSCAPPPCPSSSNFNTRTCACEPSTCPAEQPANGSACAPQTASCGYANAPNPCGAVNCTCGPTGWSCGPTCEYDAAVDAVGGSSTDASEAAPPAGDAAPGDAGNEAE